MGIGFSLPTALYLAGSFGLVGGFVGIFVGTFNGFSQTFNPPSKPNLETEPTEKMNDANAKN